MGLGGFGLFGEVGTEIFGDAPKIKPSGAFPIGTLGTDFQEFLSDRLNTPAAESEQFELGSKAIRDALTAQSATARQRLGDTANTGGFLDSGAVLQGQADIARVESQVFASELNNLLIALEDRREQNVLPFLSQGSGESVGIQSFNANAKLALQSQYASQIHDVGMAFLGGGMFGGPSGGPSSSQFTAGTGNSAPFAAGGQLQFLGTGCWVARAIYGETDPRWLLARKYIFTMAPAYLLDLYVKYGAALAEIVKVDSKLKSRLRPIFDGFVREALAS